MALLLAGLDLNVLVAAGFGALAAVATFGGIIVQARVAQTRSKAEEAKQSAAAAKATADAARDKANQAEGHTAATNDEVSRLVAAYEAQVRTHLNSITSLTELLDRATSAIEHCERDRNERGKMIEGLQRRVASLEAALAVARPDLARGMPDLGPGPDGG